MKKLVFTMIVSMLFTGAAFAAEAQQNQAQCPCTSSQTHQCGGAFKTQFPEYEIAPPLGG